MAEAYAAAWDSIRDDLAVVQAAIRNAHAQGQSVDPEWVRRSMEVQRMLRQVERQLLQLAPVVSGHCSTLAQEAVEAAVADSAQLLATAGTDVDALTYLNTRAAVQIVGVVERGPLEQLLQVRAAGAVQEAQRTLEVAVIRGWSPYRTARELERVTTTMARRYALMLARTEQLRAYREGTRQAYIANPAVQRWRWSARLAPGRTCPMCWAMHGTEHSVRRTMATHPSCMCTLLPVVAGVDYGDTGVERFANLPASEQLATLGPAAHAAYVAGDLELPDLVVQGRHPKWGMVGRAGSLAGAIGPGRAAAYIMAARP